MHIYYKSGIFAYCTSLKEIPAGLFDPLVNLEDASNLF